MVVVGLLLYLSYAYVHGSWANPTLADMSLCIGGVSPSYAKLSNKAELWANNRFGCVTGGRLGRFIPQFAFNLAVFWIMEYGRAAEPRRRGVGGRYRLRCARHSQSAVDVRGIRAREPRPWLSDVQRRVTVIRSKASCKGGMLVRQFHNECGWIDPSRIRHFDGVSATALHHGVKDMTSAVVTDVLGQLSQNLPVAATGGRHFRTIPES
jgi:hypothetical protein